MEHAFCPLDVQQALATGAIHDYEYYYQDQNRNRKRASVRVACPFGLSPNDELYLWGLLHLTFSQDEPSEEFIATPHYCLRRLGIVDRQRNQQKRYDTFRNAISRLSGVVYQNNRFYDPIRGEHRDVAFGLLKYSLPLDPQSSRAWRFVWDQQFFRYCDAMRGSFQFDLDLYRELDFASRRLFLLLKKLFWRRDSISLDVRHLAVNTLGFSASLPLKTLKVKVRHCADKLLANQLIVLPVEAESTKSLFSKRAKGQSQVTFHRGPYFEQPAQFSRRAAAQDSPSYDPLRAIGFEDDAIRRILTRHKPALVQEWADITLAAMDRRMIRKDPQAFFRYYLGKAAKKEATPPDWWRELRRREQKKHWEQQRAAAPAMADALTAQTSFKQAFDDYLEQEARGVRAGDGPAIRPVSRRRPVAARSDRGRPAFRPPAHAQPVPQQSAGVSRGGLNGPVNLWFTSSPLRRRPVTALVVRFSTRLQFLSKHSAQPFFVIHIL